MKPKKFICEICGKEFEAKASYAEFCPECRIMAKKSKTKKSPRPSKSLDEFCRELKKFNEEREKEGLMPLSYGKYTVLLQNEVHKEKHSDRSCSEA